MKALLMDSMDNVAVVLQRVSKGQEVQMVAGREVTGVMKAAGEVPFCHKIALKDIPSGADIIKYGEIIGRATQSISRGDHVHVHNVVSIRGSGSKG
jgi:altronate dehydratase small subunit